MTTPSDHPRVRCLCLDIETARQDATVLREVGAFRADTLESARIGGKARDLVARLDRLTQGAGFVLGHNLVAFDQPALALLFPDLALHQLPLVDTLELSPLAFPENPYHRLVKDYKLCSTTKNDPVRDAQLAFELFLDQQQAFDERQRDVPDEVLCLHFLMAAENGKGLANFFATVRHALRPGLAETQAAWLRVVQGKACLSAARRVRDDYLAQPDWHKSLAYVLCWLRVAGSNSVLPPWVGLQFPQTFELIRLLRDTPCADPECVWCREQHELPALLAKYFPGIERFRAKPSTPDGRSLQEAIVENGFAGRSSLAILPTGGGKSLCYQLPALARFYRNGSLTVVISPLLSLMKDQVDNLEGRGITCAGYLNSLLTPMERQAVLEKLRLGDLGLIYVAPEQFRSRAFTEALSYRTIGAWVFDEAHCLSKWGHDFRPDYLYVSRFIKGWQKERPSPVFGFTATAKPDVVADICQHFQQHLGLNLARLEGGVERENLDYEVRAVPVAAKFPEVLRLLQQALREEGAAIVFCARQKTVEEMAEFLKAAGLPCGYFHGGMDSEAKRAVQEAFIQGDLRVITATNAFGMGVDKADVRLVIHLDTPASLENYLQEAGRAGRDQAPARCLLLYDDADLDVQFRLLRNSRLTQHDIQAILKAIREIEHKDRSQGEVVVTSGEILLEIPEQQRIDPDAPDADTKVRIAISWLEEARLLARQENHTRILPGSLRIASLADAQTILEKKAGADADLGPYLKILATLLERDDDDAVSTDTLMLVTGRDSRSVRALLRELDAWGLVSNDTELGVTLKKEPDSTARLSELRRLEDALVAILRELAPDADQGDWNLLNFRRLCDTLRRDSGVQITPEHLTRLLKSFAEPFGQGVGEQGFFALRPAGRDNRHVKLLRSWQQIEALRAKRMRVAEAVLAFFQARRQGNLLLVTARQNELESALQTDITLQDVVIRDWGRALAAVLIYLDTNEVLHLARGKAVFRAAMTLQLDAEARRRQFRISDYAPLDLHYKDKVVQVHVMAEYARLALRKVTAALSFVVDYFGMERNAFIRRYFAGRKDILDIATTEAAHRRILVELQNPEQQAIVAAPDEGNLLVLAGPGSGKTRVIVHRVAWLLRERMVLPEEILVLAYNRSAAMEIRRRLWALVGPDAAGVTVQTLHGLALRLTGTSFAVAAERGETLRFAEVLKDATTLLHQAEGSGEEGAVSSQRDRVLAGLRYLLVDEYQDVNGDHYELISAIVGRTLAADEERLSLLVVGDDDQNIYGFDGANVRYIRQFEDDYRAKRHYLVENYRSSGHIIACANAVIAPAFDRMKRQQEIRINHLRRNQPPGGEFTTLDAVTQGRVHILEVSRALYSEVAEVLREIERLHALRGAAGWGGFAVIARRWQHLEPLAALCRLKGIPARLLKNEQQPDLHTTREGAALLQLLRGERRRPASVGGGKPKASRVLLRPASLSRWFRRRYGQPVHALNAHPFRAALAQFIREQEAAAPNAERVVTDLLEALYEFGSGDDAGAGEQQTLQLLAAHRAKGLEFDHVLILDGGGWDKESEDERRLYYVAMTRAKKTLTLAHRQTTRHAFLPACAPLALRSVCQAIPPDPRLGHKLRLADPSQVYLSWPGRFPPSHPIHPALAALDHGDPLILRVCSDNSGYWELADRNGTAVTRMSKAFQPPKGTLLAVRVYAILSRRDEELAARQWEVVLAEMEVGEG